MEDHTICPHCGGELKPRAVACPHCGSDESTGWKEASWEAHPDLNPMDEIDYEDVLAKEFGSKPKRSFPWKAIVAIALLALLLLGQLLWG